MAEVTVNHLADAGGDPRCGLKQCSLPLATDRSRRGAAYFLCFAKESRQRKATARGRPALRSGFPCAAGHQRAVRETRPIAAAPRHGLRHAPGTAPLPPRTAAASPSGITRRRARTAKRDALPAFDGAVRRRKPTSLARPESPQAQPPAPNCPRSPAGDRPPPGSRTRIPSRPASPPKPCWPPAPPPGLRAR